MKKIILIIASMLAMSVNAQIIESDTAIVKGDTVIIEKRHTIDGEYSVTVRFKPQSMAEKAPVRKTYLVKYNPCQAVLQDGKKCGRNSVEGKNYCYEH